MFIGVDPGASGALAIYMPAVKAKKDAPPSLLFLACYDMPVNVVKVGKTERKRLDVLGLEEMIKGILMFGAPDKVIIEDVASRPQQSGMFAFGFGVGALHATLKLLRVRFDVVTPKVWKAAVKAPKDKAQAVVRAEEIFPDHRDQWRYKAANGKAATRPDRAEAALLAYYASTLR